MISSMMEKVSGFLLDPARAFREATDDAPATVFPVFVLLLLIHAVFSALIFVVVAGSDQVPGLMVFGSLGAIVLFFGIVVCGIAGALLFGAWLHLWVFLFGGRQGIWQTLKLVLYGSTPLLLFGWIPLIGFLFVLWSLVLGIFGVRELQELSALRAILAVALAVMIPILLLIALAAYFMIASVTTTGPVMVAGQS
jgi:hypothetical protein